MAIKTMETRDSDTLADVAYKRLRRDIIIGDRPPGERLRIEKLKAIYGIGPTPLREAMPETRAGRHRGQRRQSWLLRCAT